MSGRSALLVCFAAAMATIHFAPALQARISRPACSCSNLALPAAAVHRGQDRCIALASTPRSTSSYGIADSPRQPAMRSVECRASKGFGAVKAPKKQVQSSQPVLDKCPCESGKNYKNCCQKAHEGTTPAPTPEAALRARFAAFVRNQPQHIISSTHPDYFPYHYNKPASDESAQMKFAADVEEGCSKYVYADFKIVKTEPGSHEDEGFIAFSYKSVKQPATEDEAIPDDAWSMTDEKCRFVRVNGNWLFVDYQEYTRNLTGLLKKVESKGVVQPQTPASA